MIKIDELESKVNQLEQKINISETDIRSHLDLCSIKFIEIEKQTKDNNDKILKLLLINQELVTQGKAHKELLDEIKKIQDDTKTMSVEIDGGETQITNQAFAKYILNKINPDKQIHKWSERIKDWSSIIIFVVVILYIIIQALLTKYQISEMNVVLDTLKTLK